jgi:hypothetical protein
MVLFVNTFDTLNFANGIDLSLWIRANMLFAACLPSFIDFLARLQAV